MPNNQMTPQECKKVLETMITDKIMEGKKPSIAELEEMLDKPTFQLNPDGSISAIAITGKEKEAVKYALTLIDKNEELEKALEEWPTVVKPAWARRWVAKNKILQSQNKKLEEQIDELANFIMKDVEGEPSQNQGAVETAIRIIKSLQAQNKKVKEELEALKKLIDL